MTQTIEFPAIQGVPVLEELAREIAEKMLIRVHPEMFHQFIVYKTAERKRNARTIASCQGPVSLNVLKEWCLSYDRQFNSRGEGTWLESER